MTVHVHFLYHNVVLPPSWYDENEDLERLIRKSIEALKREGHKLGMLLQEPKELTGDCSQEQVVLLVNAKDEKFRVQERIEAMNTSKFKTVKRSEIHLSN